MARYPNGRIPKRDLVHLGGEHWLTQGTKVRWDRLVADVLENEGVRLQITEGPNAYRDIEWQRYYWNTLPYPQAAYFGTSSHGGEYNGRDSMAIDVDNWGMIGKNKFYAYARKHGFEPNFFDWEPWHIIDWSPWTVPAGGGLPGPEEETPEEEDEEEMNFFNVQGKEGSHNTGLFTAMRDNNGIWFAKRFSATVNPAYPTLENTQLESWKKTMRFLDL